MTTKHAFIAAYRKRVVETYGEGAADPWAADAARLERFMQSVNMTVMTKATTWQWEGPLSRAAWRDIGCKGKLTLKALKALPEASYKPMVSTDGGKTFTGNALRFATHDEAKASAWSLMMRWTLVTDIKVEPSDDPVNYRRHEGADKPLALDVR